MPGVNGQNPFKKVEFLVAFSKNHPEIGPVTQAVLRKHQTLSLCQTDDPTVGSHSHFMAIEVKGLDGSYYGSSLQVAAWLAAGLKKTRLLQDLANEVSGRDRKVTESPLPVIGICVIGHSWYLHIAAIEENGDVVSICPYLFPVRNEILTG